MFVALCSVNQKPRGVFGGLFGALFKPPVRLSEAVALGASYGVITVCEPITRSDWKRAFSLAERFADRILLPAAVTPPDTYIPPKFPRFERLLMLNTAIGIIGMTQLPMYRRVVGLDDKNGEYADFLFPLLHHFTSVRVLTDKTGLYCAHADKMMYELGAPVDVCEDYRSFDNCALVLAPGGVSFSGSLGCPVVSKTSPKSRQGGVFITDFELVPTAELAKLAPPGIEPHLFFAAMYEYCGVGAAGFVAGRVTCRYRRTDLAQAAEAVEQAYSARLARQQ